MRVSVALGRRSAVQDELAEASSPRRKKRNALFSVFRRTVFLRGDDWRASAEVLFLIEKQPNVRIESEPAIFCAVNRGRPLYSVGGRSAETPSPACGRRLESDAEEEILVGNTTCRFQR